MRVVVTRERGYNADIISWLPDGASVAEVPLTSTRFLDTHEVLDTLRASEHYGQFRALVVTSARSALYVALAREALAPEGTVLSVGTATARALESEDVDVDVAGDSGAIVLGAGIVDGPVLLLGAAAMRDDLATTLTERGVRVTKLTCYETIPTVLTSIEELELREADVVFIGAPSAWRVAMVYIDRRTWVVVPGSTTAGVVARHHERIIEGWGSGVTERLVAL
ncbi:MAG: uroporphyrinogen-III synthase [Acidimicrobiales bacterium]